MCATAVQAQVKYLVNSHAPVDQYKCTIYKYNGPSSKRIALRGGDQWYGGFTLDCTQGPYRPGYATFNLGGRYDKLMFVLGYENESIYDGTCVFTVLADGRKILDKVVAEYDLPERITLDVSGVNELKFQIVTGYADIGVAEATLWTKGQTPKETGNLLTGKPSTVELVKDLKPYYQNHNLENVSPDSKKKSLKINGAEYNYGLAANMLMAISGNQDGYAYFNLRGQYEKLSFIAGPQDDVTGRRGKGWFTVKADGKIIYEYEMNYDDIARQVTLDVTGCQMLSFHSEQESSSTSGGLAKIMVYPAGAMPAAAAEQDAPVDPRLKSLPDVCKLMSNIPPYATGASVKDHIYDGKSDYITFSMGGVKFSEGFMLYKTANILSDNTSSYTIFDLGGEFDWVSFTAGYIGKSGAMNADILRVYGDDELLLEAPLVPTYPNMEFTLPLHKCHRLRFENAGSGNLSVAAFGIADLVVYRGQPVANNLFYHPRPECPDEIDLIDLGAPYIHYVSPRKDEIPFWDGSTQKNYFMVGDRRVNKGFALQTSVHFSLDFGPLSSGTDNAAAAAVGSAAVGASFVAGATAVGGVTVGSTLAGVAAFMLLAAGGEAVENSCAAFETYGEYNSVTFTVACIEPHNGEHPSDYNEKLIIGADHQVVAELSINETMEPQTVTVPINGCRQLMFWLSNTYHWSGLLAFYDIKLSKAKTELIIPRAARRSEAVVSRPYWSGCTFDSKWTRPKSSGAKELDAFFSKLSYTYEAIEKMMKEPPSYEIHTYYLETAAGQVCKAVQLRDTRNTRHCFYWENTLTDEMNALKRMERVRSDLNELSVMQVNAAIDLPSLGFGAISYGKIYKNATRMLKECKTKFKLMYQEQSANVAFLQAVYGNALCVDGRPSTEHTIFCPLFDGEVAPEGYLQGVERFNVE